MPRLIAFIFRSTTAAALLLAPIAAPSVSAQGVLKGAGTCLDEYKANKEAIRAAMEKKGDFILACRALPPGTPTPIGPAPGTPPAPNAPTPRNSDVGAYKTAGQCDDEYKAAKAALKAAKETKKVFVARCRSLPPGTPTPIEGAAVTPAPAPAPAPTTPAPAPASRQQPAPTAPPSSRTVNTAPPRQAGGGENACANGYAHLPASHTALQFCTDVEAQARCPGAAIVWVNTKSHIYHFAGKNTYGHTKEGAYMCETDAQGEGDRPSRNGH